MILLFTEKHEICQNTINLEENYISNDTIDGMKQFAHTEAIYPVN